MARPKGGAGKKSNVVYLDERSPPRNLAPAGEHRGRETPSETALKELESVAPVSPDLVIALNVPRLVYSHGPLSFSSNLVNPLDELTNSLIEKRPMPAILPHYGIQVSTKGNNRLCTFTDKKRRVVVFESLGSPEGGISWNPFLASLTRALDLVRMLEEQGRKFHYVVMNSKAESVT
jgi:hypothetical protein